MADRKRTDKGTWAKGVSGNPKGRYKAISVRKDGWESAITGIGNDAFDKRKSHNFAPVDLSYDQCVQIFEGDDLGKKAAEGPVNDAFRPGYYISIGDDKDFSELKRSVEKKLKKLEVTKVIKKALVQKRALGGSAILIGVNDNKPMDRPLKLDTITNIDFLTNLEPLDLVPHTYYTDPFEPKFGEVRLWQLQSFGRINTPFSGTAEKTAANKKQSSNMLIHESRLLIFNQDIVSKYTTSTNPAGQHWGLSIYTLIYEILRDFNISWSSAGLLVTDFSQAVFMIENLNWLVANDEEGLRARMQAMNLGRSVARAVLVDTNEKFERQSINVSGLPDLLVQLSRRFAAAVGQPLSVLMGGGNRNDSAEVGDELRYYHDSLEAMETDEIGPIIYMFAEILMRGERQRGLPKDWSIAWNKLWRLTEEQQANARLAQARVDAIYIKHGVLDPQTVARLRFSGEYSFETKLPNSFEAPGFMVLPPMGVLVDGMDPKTGLPPGEVPPDPTGKPSSGAGETGAHGVTSYSRRNPRQTTMSAPDPTAGGDVTGKADELPEESDDDLGDS